MGRRVECLVQQGSKKKIYCGVMMPVYGVVVHDVVDALSGVVRECWCSLKVVVHNLMVSERDNAQEGTYCLH